MANEDGFGQFYSASEQGSPARGAREPGTSPAPRIDGYRLLRAIGEGGMGVVWLAEQQRPVRRRVALKVMKHLGGAEASLRRFRAESQAMALMEHENIAKILDAGTAENGAPYFAMEFVEGEPITQFCDRRGLGLRQRLELMVSVCLAVQHAHQKGVLHRDLKPSNVLVTEQDGVAIPKVIDFGLAKALEHTTQLNDDSVRTEIGRVVGTLNYMSPEQATVDPVVDVDTRTDIYALGVLLYELLTGTTPLEIASLRQKTMVHLLQEIREGAPPPPSERLSTASALFRGGVERKVSLSKLRQVLRGELDWVVMKALDKDRDRRYPSATGLAEDLQRYMHHEPVHARPPSTSYKVKKFVRKHRAFVAVSCAFLALLIVGIALSTLFAMRSRVAERRASQAADVAQKAAIDAKATLKLLTDAFESVDPGEAGAPAVLATDVLQRAEVGLASSEMGVAAKADVLLTLARCYLSLGDHHESLGLAQQVFDASNDQTLELAEHRVQAATAIAKAVHAGGERRDALADFQTAADEARRVFGQTHPSFLRCLNNLAFAHHSIGEVKEAIELYERVLERRSAMHAADHEDVLMSQNNLAAAYETAGRSDDAIRIHKVVLASRRRKWPSGHPDVISSLNNLGVALLRTGRFDEAVPYLKEARRAMSQRFGRDHPRTLTCQNNLASALSECGDVSAAKTLHEETLAGRRRRLGDKHPDTLGSMNNLARVLVTLGEFEAATTLFSKTLEATRETLGGEHWRAFATQGSLADTLRILGRYQESLTHFSECVPKATEILPENHPLALHLQNRYSRALDAVGRFEEAIPMLQSVCRKQVRRRGTDHADAIACHLALASMLLQADRPDAARLVCFDVWEIAKDLPESRDDERAQARELLGRSLVASGRSEEGRTILEECLARYDTFESVSWRKPAVEASLGEAWLAQGNSEAALGMLTNAWKGLERSQAEIPYPDRHRMRVRVAQGLLRSTKELGLSEESALWESECASLSRGPNHAEKASSE